MKSIIESMPQRYHIPAWPRASFRRRRRQTASQITECDMAGKNESLNGNISRFVSKVF